jgi:hypothetical protein
MKIIIDNTELEVSPLRQWWVAKKFAGITINGVIYIRDGVKMTDEFLRHEGIHVLQQKELGYILFLIKYIGYWIIKCGYMKIPFEREAYANEAQRGYLNTRPGSNWKKYRL